MLQLKRIYAPASPEDGFRILIDRLWPRGISKERAALDDWAKAITPSPDLRKEYHAGLFDYDGMTRRYQAELENNPAIPGFENLLKEKLKQGNVTLLYGSKDPNYNHGTILMNFLKEHGIQ